MFAIDNKSAAHRLAAARPAARRLKKLRLTFLRQSRFDDECFLSHLVVMGTERTLIRPWIFRSFEEWAVVFRILQQKNAMC